MDAAPRERELDANALHFHALEWDGAAPPALFVHATSFCADAWQPVIASMRACDRSPRRAVAFDQRGHGRSDAPALPSDYQWTHLAADVAALASAVTEGSAPVVGVGHSSGATALLAAAGLAPQRFDALVAIEPVLFGARGPADPDSFAGSSFLAGSARRRRDRFASRDAARERLRTRPPFAGFDPEAFDAALHGMLADDGDGVVLRCPGEREAWCYEGANALDLWPLTAKIRAPLLLVLGENSSVSLALRERLLAAVPAQVATIAGGTHFTALERPREVGAAIAHFLAARA